MILKKTISLTISFCFLFSFVLKDTILAATVKEKPAYAFSENLSMPLFELKDGKMTDSYVSESDKIIINIQDIHCNGEIQKKISSILSEINEKYGIDRIYLEGAAGKLSTKWLSFGNGRYSIAEKLVEEGKITGAEYCCAVNSGMCGILYGLENKELYLENFGLLAEIYGFKNNVNGALDAIEKKIAEAKNLYFSGKNKKTATLVEKHNKNEIDFKKYSAVLKKRIFSLGKEEYSRNVSFKSRFYDEGMLFKTNEVFEKNSEINHKKLNTELESALAELKTKLPFKEYTKLANSENLKDIVRLINGYEILDVKKYPEMQKFTAYCDLVLNYDEQEMFREDKKLVRELMILQSRSYAETEVVFLNDYFGYLRGFVNNAVSNEEYSYFCDNFETFNSLLAKYCGNGELQQIMPEISTIKKFFDNNLKRNDVFVKNMLSPVPAKESGKTGKTVIVCITGGFHSGGMAEILKEKGISYAVIMPNLSDFKDSTGIYDSIFAERLDFAANMYNLPVLSGLAPYVKAQQMLLITVNELIARRGFENVRNDLASVSGEITQVWNEDSEIYSDLGKISVSQEEGFISFELNGEKINIEISSSGKAELKVLPQKTVDTTPTRDLIKERFGAYSIAPITLKASYTPAEIKQISMFMAASISGKRMMEFEIEGPAAGESNQEYYARLLFITNAISLDVFEKLDDENFWNSGKKTNYVSSGLPLVFRELFRNALVHGNKLNPERKIYMYFDSASLKFMAANLEYDEEIEPSEKGKAGIEGLFGEGEGHNKVASKGTFTHGTETLSNGQKVYIADLKGDRKNLGILAIMQPFRNTFKGAFGKVIDWMAAPLAGAPVWESVYIAALYFAGGFTPAVILFAFSHIVADWLAKARDIKTEEGVGFMKALGKVAKSELSLKGLKKSVPALLFFAAGAYVITLPFTMAILPVYAVALSGMLHFAINLLLIETGLSLSIVKHSKNRYNIYDENGALVVADGEVLSDITAKSLASILPSLGGKKVILRGGVIGSRAAITFLGVALFVSKNLSGYPYELVYQNGQITDIIIKDDEGRLLERRQPYVYTDSKGREKRIWLVKEMSGEAIDAYNLSGTPVKEITVEKEAGGLIDSFYVIGPNTPVEYINDLSQNSKITVRGQKIDDKGSAFFLGKHHFVAADMKNMDAEISVFNGEVERITISDDGELVEERSLKRYAVDGKERSEWIITNLSEEGRIIYEERSGAVTEINVRDSSGNVLDRFYYIGKKFPSQYFSSLTASGEYLVTGAALSNNGTAQFSAKYYFRMPEYAGFNVEYYVRDSAVYAANIVDENGEIVERAEPDHEGKFRASGKQNAGIARGEIRKDWVNDIITFTDSRGLEITSIERRFRGRIVSAFDELIAKGENFTLKGLKAADNGKLQINFGKRANIRTAFQNMPADAVYENGKLAYIVFRNDAGEKLAEIKVFEPESGVREFIITEMTAKGREFYESMIRSGQRVSELVETQVLDLNGNVIETVIYPKMTLPASYFSYILQQHQDIIVENIPADASGHMLFGKIKAFTERGQQNSASFVFKGGRIDSVVIKDGTGTELETRKPYYTPDGKLRWAVTGITDAGKTYYEKLGIQNRKISFKGANGIETAGLYFIGTAFPSLYFNELADNIQGDFSVEGFATDAYGVLTVGTNTINVFDQNNMDEVSDKSVVLNYKNGTLDSLTVAATGESMKVVSYFEESGEFDRYLILRSRPGAARHLNTLQDGVLRGVRLDPQGNFPFGLAPRIQGMPGETVDVEIKKGVVTGILEDSLYSENISSGISAESANTVSDKKNTTGFIKPVAELKDPLTAGISSLADTAAGSVMPANGTAALIVSSDASEVLKNSGLYSREIIVTDKRFDFNGNGKDTHVKILFSVNGKEFTANVRLNIYNVSGAKVPSILIGNVQAVNPGESMDENTPYLAEAAEALYAEIENNPVLMDNISRNFKVKAVAGSSEKSFSEKVMDIQTANRTALNVSASGINMSFARYLVYLAKSSSVGSVVLRDLPSEMSKAQNEAVRYIKDNGINVVRDFGNAGRINIESGFVNPKNVVASVKASNSFEIYFGKGATLNKAAVDAAVNTARSNFEMGADDLYYKALAHGSGLPGSVYDDIIGFARVILADTGETFDFAGLFEALNDADPEMLKDIISLSRMRNAEETDKAKQYIRGLAEAALIQKHYKKFEEGKISDAGEALLLGKLLFEEAVEGSLPDIKGGEITEIMHNIMPETLSIEKWTDMDAFLFAEFKKLLSGSENKRERAALLAAITIMSDNRLSVSSLSVDDPVSLNSIEDLLKAA